MMKKLLNSKTFWELVFVIPTFIFSFGIMILIILALIKFIWG